MTLHAAGTAFNDRCDVAIDRLARPHRPLPSGRLSLEYAERLSVVLVVVGLCLSATLGIVAVAMAALVAIASAAYAVRLKNSVLIGNLTVATLSGATVPFGASAVLPGEAIPGSAVRGGLLILLYMVAYEVLKCLQDLESDAASGLHTIATRWGPPAARATAVAALAGFGSVAVWPLVAGAASAAYSLAVLLPLGCVVGCALSAYLVRPPCMAWDRAVAWLKVGWFLSLPALGLLT
jgi:geranylgeranylglycerol-phosphate geranylgeranyltransferase